MDKTPLLTLRALARHLCVAPGWLRSEAAAGRLPHLRAGRQWLFNLHAVELELAERAARPDVADADGQHATPAGEPETGLASKSS